MLAESYTDPGLRAAGFKAPRVIAGTLTYGGDKRINAYEVLINPHAQTLHYEDVVIWMKRLRRNCGLVRYFVAGEYGPEKQRCHWHFVCWFYGDVPPNLLWNFGYIHDIRTQEQADALKASARAYRFGLWGKGFQGPLPRWVSSGLRARRIKLWDHGWTEQCDAHENSFSYAAKYAVKDVGPEGEDGRPVRQKTLGISSQPPLGLVYFTQRLARDYVGQGLTPRDLGYEMPNGSGHLHFVLRGRAAVHYLDGFIRWWMARHDNMKWMQSDLVDEHIFNMERRLVVAAAHPTMSDKDFYEKNALLLKVLGVKERPRPLSTEEYLEVFRDEILDRKGEFSSLGAHTPDELLRRIVLRAYQEARWREEIKSGFYQNSEYGRRSR